MTRQGRSTSLCFHIRLMFLASQPDDIKFSQSTSPSCESAHGDRQGLIACAKQAKDLVAAIKRLHTQ